MVIENNYTDKFYLDDYLHFYASCFNSYDKVCKRIHFFSSKVNKEQFLDNSFSNKQTLQQGYLGCIVVKPIPTFIGRTLLSPYPKTNMDPIKGNQIETRHIFAHHKSIVNLFGTELEIKSLSFQEQDQIISACATTALWTVLEKVCNDYGYYWPTPFEITQSANKNNCVNRETPSSGLTLFQIINAIKYFGMELQVSDLLMNPSSLESEGFLSELYAYLHGGFPILLGIDIDHDKHAVAVLGYELEKKHPSGELPLIGNQINKIFVHDDNFCPFTKYDVNFDADKHIYFTGQNWKDKKNPCE